jgi:hypothetical protein
MGIAGGNCLMAFAGVVGTVCRDRTDLLIGWNLIQKFGQHGGISDIAAGDFDSPNLQSFFVDPEVDLAPYPAFGTAMLAGVPFTFTL